MVQWTMARPGDLGPQPRQRATMTPVRATMTARNQRTGRDETIEAESTDGHWGYRRLDDDGTTWDAMFLPTGQTLGEAFGTLDAARAFTARPGLAQALYRTTTRIATQDVRNPADAAEAITRKLAGDILAVFDAHRKGCPACC